MGVPYTRGLHEVADGVFAWLQPDGGWGWSNAGLVVDGGSALLVDTLFDLRLTAEMLAAMRAAAPTSSIGTVVNTHANGDHCYGNQLLAGARIIASAAAAEEMSHVPPSVLASLMRSAEPGSYVQRIFGAFDFEAIALCLPTSTFSGSLSVPVGGTAVELEELGPAHTAGDVVAVVPSARVVFTGDLLFVGGHPIVWAGPVANWVAALDRILAMDVDVIVPGHGPVTDKAGVREVRSYFVELEAAARPLYDEGLTPLEAARALRPRLGAGWGESERLVVNVAACYRSYGSTAEVDTFADMAALAATP
ncbi:MAG TPA: MBL fold metallo-hydrolase [Acidimicrobiales bacterium]|nr:MBL fold metallo-hydrolase [Acidimicrobiales bacterium]